MSWPTISKGIFNPGFNKGKSQGTTPKERSNEPAKSSKVSPETAKGRVLKPAKSTTNAKAMRIPFGGKKK